MVETVVTGWKSCTVGERFRREDAIIKPSLELYSSVFTASYDGLTKRYDNSILYTGGTNPLDLIILSS